MSALTIDRVDHADPAAISGLAAPIARVADTIRSEYAAKPDAVGTALPERMSTEDVAALVERLGTRGGVFYCRDGDEVVAFSMVQPDQQEPSTAVMGVWVRDSHRRRGIGTELARAGTEFAREAGYTKIRGTIPSRNAPALSFFSAIGPIVRLESGGMGYELPV
jgi:ribosomal protein S18 acetylase RimI-like enzyme